MTFHPEHAFERHGGNQLPRRQRAPDDEAIRDAARQMPKVGQVEIPKSLNQEEIQQGTARSVVQSVILRLLIVIVSCMLLFWVAQLARQRVSGSFITTLMEPPPGGPDPNIHNHTIYDGFPLPWQKWDHCFGPEFDVWHQRGTNWPLLVASFLLASAAPLALGGLFTERLRLRRQTTRSPLFPPSAIRWARIVAAAGAAGIVAATCVLFFFGTDDLALFFGNGINHQWARSLRSNSFRWMREEGFTFTWVWYSWGAAAGMIVGAVASSLFIRLPTKSA